MKKVLPGVIIMLWAYLCSAQKINQAQFFLSKGLIDIQYGSSVPIADYALSDTVLPAGYAQNGYNLKIGFNYDLSPYIGFAMQYQHVQNPFNSNDYLSDLQSIPSDITFNSYSSDPWELNGILMGVYYPLKAAKTTIDIRLLGGLFFGTLPESELNVTYPSLNNLTLNFKQYENNSSGLGYQAGIKIRHQLYKKLVLTSSIDYTQSKINFDDIRVIETHTNQSFRGDDYSQKFQFFNFSIGVGIQFD